MQELFIGDSTDPIRVVRAFSNMVDNSQNTILFEFEDGSFGYPGGDKIKTEAEVANFPEVHRRRALNWLKVNCPEKTKEKDAKRKAELFKMTKPQLVILAGVPSSTDADPTKDSLINKILDKENKE